MKLKLLTVLIALGMLFTLELQADKTTELQIFLTAAEKITAQTYPDSDTVLIYNVENIRYDEKGLSTSTDEYYQKVLTEKGRKQLRSFTFHFNTTYESLKIEKVQIIRGGKRLIIDPVKNSKVSIEPGQMGSNIYDPANKILTLTIPGLEVGDIVGLKVRSDVKKARIPGFWGSYIPLQSNTPILKYEVNVDAPAALPLKSIAVKDKDGKGVTFTQKKVKDRIHYRWTAENVPQVIPEPDMPPLYTAVQRLLIGTAGDWKEISKWYYNLCRPRLDTIDAAIKKKVAELTRNCKNRNEKIMALFQFVSQQIRYMGLTPEAEAPGYEPHDVTMTFHQRYGVCRDKAALLAAMLEAAGLKAYPVMIMAGIPKDDDVPNGYFNHAITAVETAPGEYILMDPTNESARELLPATLANCSYLVAKPEGDKLRRTPSPDSKYNSLIIKSSSELDGNGLLSGVIDLHFTGVNDMLYRDALSRWTPEEADQYFSRQLNAAVPGAELTKMEISPNPVRDMSRKLQIRLYYTAENMLPSRNGPAILQLPELGDSIGASGFLLGSFALEKRRFKLQIPSTFSVRESYQLKLPQHLKVLSVPAAEHLAEKNLISWNRKIRQDQDMISGERLFSVNSLEFTPAEYAKSRLILQQMDMKKRALPIVENDFTLVKTADMQKVFSGADTLMLKDSSRWTLADGGNWIEEHNRRIKILTYAGMKDSSEIRIAYNPVWEKVEISGKVFSADGRKRELKNLEKNIMDAPWNASAPRYPGGKILVANLPGVEVGSELEIKIKRIVRRPYFAQILTFAGYAPGLEKERIIDVPERVFLRFSQTPPGVEFKEERSGNRKIYSWTAKNLRRLPSERSQAPLWNFAPTVLVSTGNWKMIAGKTNAVLQKLSSPVNNPAAKQLADKLLAGRSAKGNKQERLRNRITVLRDFAAKYIRPAGPGLDELPLDKLSTADETLKSGYGNSADRAILLGALLRSSGIDVEFVPVSDTLSEHKFLRGLERFPQQILTDVLVHIPAAGIYLNDTSQYAEPGTLHHANRIGLSLKSSRLEALRPALKYENHIERLVQIDIRNDGSADIKVSDKTYGTYFESSNRKYAELTPELRKRHFAELASNFSRAAKITGTPETDFNTYPGEVNYSLHCPGFVVFSGEYGEFDLPFFKLFSSLTGNVKKNRRTPYQKKEAFSLTIRYVITYPQHLRISTGRAVLLRLGDHSIGRFSQNYVSGNGKLDMTCKIKIPAGITPAMDCDRLFTLHQQLARPNTGKIVLIPRKGTNK